MASLTTRRGETQLLLSRIRLKLTWEVLMNEGLGLGGLGSMGFTV